MRGVETVANRRARIGRQRAGDVGAAGRGCVVRARQVIRRRRALIVALLVQQRPVVGRLNVEMVKALNASDVSAKLDQIGLTVIANTPEEFGALLARSIELYRQAAKLAGVKPE